MPEKADQETLRQQLLQALDGLDAEQRRLDLRDKEAIRECQRKIDVVRARIKRLGAAAQDRPSRVSGG